MMLGQLQMHRLRSKSLSYDQVKAGAQKDMEKSPFDCARKLLSFDSSALTMGDKLDCVFQDMDLVPLLVQVRKAYRNQSLQVSFRSIQYLDISASSSVFIASGNVAICLVSAKDPCCLQIAGELFESPTQYGKQ